VNKTKNTASTTNTAVKPFNTP